MPSVDRKIRFVFHSLGLSCLGGSIFLQVLVFSGIFQRGYFTAIEQNFTVLTFEIILTGFAVIYFIYIFQRLMRQFN